MFKLPSKILWYNENGGKNISNRKKKHLAAISQTRLWFARVGYELANMY